MTMTKHIYFLSTFALALVSPSIKITSSQLKLFGLILTHFSPMFQFYTPQKHQKTKGFLAFSVGIEMGHWAKMC